MTSIFTSAEERAVQTRLNQIINGRDTIHDDLRDVTAAIEEGASYEIEGVQIDPLRYKSYLVDQGATLEGPEKFYVIASLDPRTAFGGGTPDPKKNVLVKGCSYKEFCSNAQQ